MSITPIGEAAVSRAGILIIGAGTSGLQTALELARRGVPDICVVSAGNFHGFAHWSAALPKPEEPLLGAVGWAGDSGHYGRAPGVRSAIGGRSRGWQGVVLRVRATVLRDRWPQGVASRLLGTGPGSYAAVEEDLTAWRGSPLDAAQSDSDTEIAGVLRNWVSDISPTPQAGKAWYDATSRHWDMYSPLQTWNGAGLERFSRIKLPRILTGARAINLARTRNRVHGAVFTDAVGNLHEILADTIVLAAGTLENTRLYAQGLAAVDEKQLVWPDLNDHIEHGIIVPLPNKLSNRWAAERVFLWADRESDFLANLFVDIHAGGLPAPVLDIWWMAQQAEPFRDAIAFRPNGHIWTATVRGRLRRADNEWIARREDALRGILESLDVRHVADRQPLLYEQAVTHALKSGHPVRYLNPLGSSDHEAGTLPLGQRLESGGRVPWARNLFVAGPASFPPAGAVNPTLTILALAAQTAQAIAD